MNLAERVRRHHARMSRILQRNISKTKPPSSRTAQIIAMYRSGSTLNEVGQEFGIARERARQILRREGVSSKEGGKAVKNAPTHAARMIRLIYLAHKRARAKFERRCSKCKEIKPLETFPISVHGTDKRSYRCKKCTAKESNRRYYDESTGDRERRLAWQRANPEKVREYQRRSKAKRMALDIDSNA